MAYFETSEFRVTDVRKKSRQCLIEFGEHPVRIDEGLQLRPLDQRSLVPMPAITVNQILIQGRYLYECRTAG
jgi:hypothetical protein